MEGSTMNTEIRAAAAGDAEAIADLSGQLGYPATGEEVRARLDQIERRGDGQVFVATEGGAVAGWIHVFGTLVLESPASAEIGGLVVDGKSRGRGIGAALMSAAEAWAREAGHGTVRLRSNVIRERAHRFYERLGYARTKQQVVFARTIAGPGDRR
jgi:GNAT superfamily N-acetyltransferase